MIKSPRYSRKRSIVWSGLDATIVLFGFNSISFGLETTVERRRSHSCWLILPPAICHPAVPLGIVELPHTLERLLRARDKQEESPARARPNARELNATPVPWCRDG